MNTQLAENVHWIGYIDWSVREFHGYDTKRGSTYNAYLVQGSEKTAVIDAVKAPYVATLIQHIQSHTTLDKIDYVVCNHAEPDHSGGLPTLLKACPKAVLVCNAKCKDALEHHYDTSDWNFQVITEGETLSLGDKTLQFFDATMVHWPESMATYLQEDQILFSMDAFGQHYASSERFDDEADMAEVMQEAKTYYANIVLPFATPVERTIQKLGALPFKIVAPSHGVIWRSHFDRILSAYLEWRVSKPAKKVVIFFSTMWQSTRHMAEAIAAGVNEYNVELKFFDLHVTSDTQIITDLMDCAAFAVGTPTLNQGCFPRMAAALTYVRGLKPAGKTAVAFGSYGWASKGAEEAAAYLEAMKTTQISPPITCRFAPDATALEACREAGRKLAQAALAVEG